MLEPKTGVFLGNPSARVRDELWERALKSTKGTGSILQLWSDKNPQGFSFRQSGISAREIVDFEGVLLVQINRQISSSAQNADTER
jgi:CRISPR-associated protein Cas2